jgi:hypothetical protein
MKVKTAQAGSIRQCLERRHLIGRVNQRAGPSDGRSLAFGDARFVWSTPFARPEARPLRILTREMESDILASRQTRRT